MPCHPYKKDEQRLAWEVGDQRYWLMLLQTSHEWDMWYRKALNMLNPEFLIVRFLAPSRFIGFAYDFFRSWKCVCRSPGYYHDYVRVPCGWLSMCTKCQLPLLLRLHHAGRTAILRTLCEVVRDRARTVQFPCEFDSRRAGREYVLVWSLPHEIWHTRD